MENRNYIVLRVSPNFLLDNIKANVMYTSYPFNIYNKVNMGDSTFFINNGNIYCEFRVFGDGQCEETYMCCSLAKLKRFITATNIKNFVACRERKEQLETIEDLYEMVINCGFTRKIDYEEYYEAILNLKSDFSKRWKFENFKFIAQALNNKSHPGDTLICKSKWGTEITLDMVSDKRKQCIPDSIKDKITDLANNMLEENSMDIKNVCFLLHAKINFEAIGSLYKSYQVYLIMVNNCGQALKEKRFCLCDCTKEMENAMEEYFKNELFPTVK